MDELLADAGDECPEHHTNVGHLHGMFESPSGAHSIGIILTHCQAEEQGFSRFHVYVCAAFLVKWSDQLIKMDFQVGSDTTHI